METIVFVNPTVHSDSSTLPIKTYRTDLMVYRFLRDKPDDSTKFLFVVETANEDDTTFHNVPLLIPSGKWYEPGTLHEGEGLLKWNIRQRYGKSTIHELNDREQIELLIQASIYYQIDHLISGIEHVRFLRTLKCDFSQTRELDLFVESDDFHTKNNIHMKNDFGPNDFYQLSLLIFTSMRKIQKVAIKVEYDFKKFSHIPRFIGSLVFDNAAFRTARGIEFQTYGKFTDIQGLWKDEKDVKQIEICCPFIPIGSDTFIRRSHWYKPLVLTFLQCEQLERQYPQEYKQMQVVAYYDFFYKSKKARHDKTILL